LERFPFSKPDLLGPVIKCLAGTKKKGKQRRYTMGYKLKMHLKLHTAAAAAIISFLGKSKFIIYRRFAI
jgi:hypothetical protein